MLERPKKHAACVQWFSNRPGLVTCVALRITQLLNVDRIALPLDRTDLTRCRDYTDIDAHASQLRCGPRSRGKNRPVLRW